VLSLYLLVCCFAHGYFLLWKRGKEYKLEITNMENDKFYKFIRTMIWIGLALLLIGGYFVLVGMKDILTY
jgi:hypothetical protein